MARVSEEERSGWCAVNTDKQENRPVTGQKIDLVNENNAVGGLVEKIFRFLTAACAVIHFIIIVIQSFAKSTSQEHAFALSTCEQIVLTVFLFDILVKWYDGFKTFWRSWWNIANFLMTLTYIVGHRITSHPTALIFLKVLGMIRIFKCCTFSPVIMRGAQVIITSVAELKIVFLVFLVFMLAYAVCGVQLLSTTVPSAFGDLPSALYTLFVCATQDGWTDIYNKFKEDSNANTFLALLYFVIFLIFSTFIFALIDAVLIGNVQHFIVKPDDEQSKEENDSTEDRSEDDAIHKDEGMIHVDKVVTETNMTKRQKPLKNGYPENLTVETLEDLILIMSAIDRNIEECNEIERELEKILEEVCNLNANKMEAKTSAHENLIKTDLATSDIFTALFDFEGAHASETSEDNKDPAFTDNEMSHCDKL